MGWSRNERAEALTARETFELLARDDLQSLTKLVDAKPPKRKGELVPLLARVMTDPKRIRELYDRLDPISQNAIRVAVFDPDGRLDQHKFRAWFGEMPPYNEKGSDSSTNRELRWSRYSDQRNVKPTLLRLFFPRYDYLPTDTRTILQKFVLPPDPFAIPIIENLPKAHKLHEHVWKKHGIQLREWEERVQVREMAVAAAADLRTVLRLIDTGKIRVTDIKLIPTQASRQAIAKVLTGDDFYASDIAEKAKYDPAFDLGIRSFAWPLLVQAGGLAEKSGDALKLTAAGKKALTAPVPDLLRKLWTAWLKNRAFDEFARVDTIKGQGRARMSSAANRRSAVVAGLAACPVGRWFAVNDLFRLLQATGQQLTIAHNVEELYIAEHLYGNFGYDFGDSTWELLEGRFTLAFLFEYAATLGAIDVAYIPPQHARLDFNSRWGVDDLTCLSRYDGLLYLRVNTLGAWLLGLADEYRSEEPTKSNILRALANRDVVTSRGFQAADQLVLERFAESTSEGVWTLSAAKILGMIEQGGSIDEVEHFLATHTTGDLPGTVVTFLNDLRAKASRLSDAGPARLIACADEHVATELTADRHLKGKCIRAGDRFVVVREADLNAVRKVIRKRGYVWPVPSD